MLEARIQQQFYDTADNLVQAAEALSRPLAAAVELVLSTITGGGKLLSAGTGFGHADALQAAAGILGAMDRPRPGLPAMALGSNGGELLALSQAGGDPVAALARQVQALGLPGDLLLVFEGHAAAGPLPALGPLIEAAHGREMSVILWTATARDAQGAPTAEWLTDMDVHIDVRADRPSQASTLYRLGWLAVADALDLQLLGEPD